MGIFNKKGNNMSNKTPMPPPMDNNTQEMQGGGEENYYDQGAAPAQNYVEVQQYNQEGYGNYNNQPQGQTAYSQNGYQGVENNKERIEEIAEAIIDEKWTDFMKDINKVIEWKERTDGEIKRIQQEILDLKERFNSLHSGVLGKITEYDQNLSNVGTEIKAMEMTFQKILPTFTDNINKLDRIVKNSNSK